MMARGIGEIGLYPLSIYYTTNVWKKDHGKNKEFFFSCLVLLFILELCVTLI